MRRGHLMRNEALSLGLLQDILKSYLDGRQLHTTCQPRLRSKPPLSTATIGNLVCSEAWIMQCLSYKYYLGLGYDICSTSDAVCKRHTLCKHSHSFSCSRPLCTRIFCSALLTNGRVALRLYHDALRYAVRVTQAVFWQKWSDQ